MVDDNCPDMVGMFSEDQIAFGGCDILHKDRSDSEKNRRRRSTRLLQNYKLWT